MDIALYTGVDRIPENCAVVVETKTMFSGLDGAVEQVERYRENAPTAGVVVTDGNQIELHPDAFHVGHEPIRGNLRIPNIATQMIVEALTYRPTRSM